MSPKKISFVSLILLIVAAIDSIRNLPASALFGSALIFFFIFSAIVFLIPTALISAELSATFPEKGGVYHWVYKAFGEKWAMVAIWLQWINTMVWYPTILSFIAGTAAYLIDPKLAQNPWYLVSVILVIFWALTVVNLKGLHISARVNNFCATIGTILPMLFLIALGAFWVLSGKPQQILITPETVIPSFSNTTSWISLIAIMASFLGMELSGVHVSDIRNPQKNFPRAVLISSLFILLSMIFGSLTIAFVLPEKEINLVVGVMQVFSNFFDVFGLRPLTPILTVLIVFGSIGGMINWLISPAKGLMHAAEFGYLPKFFRKKNKNDVASRILIAQALLVSVVCAVFLFVPSVNGFYWFLTALSTELYMLMYILMFASALWLRHTYINRPKVFRIPGGIGGMWLVALLGFFGCSATVLVSFFPPDNVDVGGSFRYVTMICSGNILALAPILFFFWYKKKNISIEEKI